MLTRSVPAIGLLKTSILSLFLILIFGQTLHAGLILEIARDFDVSKIQEITVRGNILTIRYEGGSRSLELPEGGVESVILWAGKEAVGPFVFSVDGALVPGAPDYIAPSLPPALGRAMLSYDIYAHELGLGQVPYDTLKHPLIALSGSAAMPHIRKQWLLDPANMTEAAIWYRRLAARYATEPGAIGEFTIIATPSDKDFPVKIAARSHRWIRPHVWYLGKSVPSQWDHWALNLPYQPLKEDIERRFPDYRKAFKPLDELACIVEAYAILKALRTQKPTLWNKVVKDVFGVSRKPTAVGGVYDSDSPSLTGPDDYGYDYYGYGRWDDLVLAAIGDEVETTAEAELAIARLWSNRYGNIYDNAIWEEGIEAIAENNAEIKAKWMLLQIKQLNKGRDTTLTNQAVRDFFSFTKQRDDLLRIRIAGYNLLKDIYISNFTSKFRSERSQIISDFSLQVYATRKRVGESNRDYTVWEDLSQCVYSAGLIDIAEDAYPYGFDSEFSAALAYVHYRRGIAEQRGMEIAYRHAHFRFLYYLKEKTEYDEKLFKTIDGYRAEIAKMLDMEGWKEDDFDWDIAESDDYSDYSYGEQEKTPEAVLPSIEGTLIASDELFEGSKTLTTNFDAFAKGIPVGVWMEGEKFALLLVDSRVLLSLRQKFNRRTTVKVRAEGILHDGGRAFTPLKMQYLNGSEWHQFDLPFAGTIGPFSLTGGQ